MSQKSYKLTFIISLTAKYPSFTLIISHIFLYLPTSNSHSFNPSKLQLSDLSEASF